MLKDKLEKDRAIEIGTLDEHKVPQKQIWKRVAIVFINVTEPPKKVLLFTEVTEKEGQNGDISKWNHHWAIISTLKNAVVINLEEGITMGESYV